MASGRSFGTAVLVAVAIAIAGTWTIGARRTDAGGDVRAAAATPTAEPGDGVATTRRPGPPRALLVGDSLMAQTAPALESRLARAGWEVHARAAPGTGLVHPGSALDWGPALADALAEHEPDLVIALFTGNYFPPYASAPDGRDVLPGTAQYFALWAAAAADATERVVAAGARLVWVLPPVMRDPVAAATTAAIGGMHLRLADEHAAVSTVDADAVLAGGGRRFLASAPGPDGSPVALRADDGGHLTPAGAERLATLLADAVQDVHVHN